MDLNTTTTPPTAAPDDAQKEIKITVPLDLLAAYPREVVLDHVFKLFERLRIVGRLEHSPGWND
jgi:hypothetical protein